VRPDVVLIIYRYTFGHNIIIFAGTLCNNIYIYIRLYTIKKKNGSTTIIILCKPRLLRYIDSLHSLATSPPRPLFFYVPTGRNFVYPRVAAMRDERKYVFVYVRLRFYFYTILHNNIIIILMQTTAVIYRCVYIFLIRSLCVGILYQVIIIYHFVFI